MYCDVCSGFMDICFSHFLHSQTCWLYGNYRSRLVHLLLIPHKTVTGTKHSRTHTSFLGLPSVTADYCCLTWKKKITVAVKAKTDLTVKKCQTSVTLVQNKGPETRPRSLLSLQLSAGGSELQTPLEVPSSGDGKKRQHTPHSHLNQTKQFCCVFSTNAYRSGEAS